MRLDQFLVKCQKASSRTQAQDLIANGFVYLETSGKKQNLGKPSFEVSVAMEAFIFVESNPIQKFASRGGLKLEAALAHIPLSVKDKIVLDVGQSTGGFTDCLLVHGAAKVVGIDVGHHQVIEVIKQNKNVQCFEGLHVKDLSSHPQFLASVPENKFDLIVADVSFISLTKIMAYLKPFLAAKAEYLFLVKPQFEAGPDALDKNGIVKNVKFYSVIEKNLTECATQHFGNVTAYFSSALTGKDGNQEFFIYGKNQL